MSVRREGLLRDLRVLGPQGAGLLVRVKTPEDLERVKGITLGVPVTHEVGTSDLFPVDETPWAHLEPVHPAHGPKTKRGPRPFVLLAPFIDGVRLHFEAPQIGKTRPEGPVILRDGSTLLHTI